MVKSISGWESVKSWVGYHTRVPTVNVLSLLRFPCSLTLEDDWAIILDDKPVFFKVPKD